MTEVSLVMIPQKEEEMYFEKAADLSRASLHLSSDFFRVFLQTERRFRRSR